MNLKQNKVEKSLSTILYILLVFYLLFITDSLIFQVNVNPIFNRISQIMLLIVGPSTFITYLLTRKIKINFDFIFFTFSIITLLITFFLNVDNRLVVPIKIAVIMFGYSAAKIVNLRKLITVFIHIMAFISVYSLIVYSISDVIISTDYFPRITTINGVQSIFLIFTNVPILISNYRNWGPFWEPGAYQVYLSLSIILLLFYYKASKLNKVILFIIYLTTFFTVLSTTGLITLPFIILAFIINRNDLSISPGYKLAFITIVITFSISLLLNEDLINKVFLSKFIDPVQSDRFDTVLYGFDLWIKRPLFGYGSFYREAMHFAAGEEFSITNSIVVSFVAFGSFFGVYFLYGLKKMIDSLQLSLASTIILYIAIGLMLSGNNFIYSPTIALFMFLRFNKGNTVYDGI